MNSSGSKIVRDVGEVGTTSGELPPRLPDSVPAHDLFRIRFSLTSRGKSMLCHVNDLYTSKCIVTSNELKSFQLIFFCIISIFHY
jgi:hypothetical protein